MSDQNKDYHKATESDAYKKSLGEAEKAAKDEKEAIKIIDKASKRSGKFKESVGKLNDLFKTITTFVKMLRAYYSGKYTHIPWGTIVKMMSGLIYFVFIIDFIPDFIPIIGFLDDATVALWILGSIKGDIDKFAEWEATQKAAIHEPA